MPTATKKPAPKKPAANKPRASHPSADATDRLSESLEAAQKALSALGSDVSQGTRDLKANLERLIQDARRDAAKLAEAVRSDLDEFRKSVSKGAERKPPAPRRTRA
jgi:ABC-type transporter Mla subunit MlaD